MDSRPASASIRVYRCSEKAGCVRSCFSHGRKSGPLLCFWQYTCMGAQSSHMGMLDHRQSMCDYVCPGWSRTREPLLNLRLFRNTAFTISLAVSLILTFALYSGVYFIPLFLEEIQGLSPFRSGCCSFRCGVPHHRYLPVRGWYASWGPALLITLGDLILFVTTFRFSRLHMETTLITVMIWMCIRNVGSGLAISPATSARWRRSRSRNRAMRRRR